MVISSHSGPTQCPNQPGQADAERVSGPAFGRRTRAPSREPRVTCNTRCHAPVISDRENCPGQDFSEKFWGGRRREFVTKAATDYYRCNPDCWGHQIALRSDPIGKCVNIISFLIANWTTSSFILTIFQLFDKMFVMEWFYWHIFVEKVNENVVNQSFLQGMFTSLRDPK